MISRDKYLKSIKELRDRYQNYVMDGFLDESSDQPIIPPGWTPALSKAFSRMERVNGALKIGLCKGDNGYRYEVRLADASLHSRETASYLQDIANDVMNSLVKNMQSHCRICGCEVENGGICGRQHEKEWMSFLAMMEMYKTRNLNEHMDQSIGNDPGIHRQSINSKCLENVNVEPDEKGRNDIKDVMQEWKLFLDGERRECNGKKVINIPGVDVWRDAAMVLDDSSIIRTGEKVHDSLIEARDKLGINELPMLGSIVVTLLSGKGLEQYAPAFLEVLFSANGASLDWNSKDANRALAELVGQGCEDMEEISNVLQFMQKQEIKTQTQKFIGGINERTV